jgi:hypothetical protein
MAVATAFPVKANGAATNESGEIHPQHAWLLSRNYRGKTSVNCVTEEDSRNELNSAEKQEKSLLELIGVSASILAILATAAVYGAGTALRAGYL